MAPIAGVIGGNSGDEVSSTSVGERSDLQGVADPASVKWQLADNERSELSASAASYVQAVQDCFHAAPSTVSWVSEP